MSPPSQLPVTEGSTPRDGLPKQSLLLVLPRFLREETGLLSGRFILLTLLSGLTNGVVIAIVLGAIHAKSENGDAFIFGWMFVFSIAIFAMSRTYVQNQTVLELEAITRRIRLRIADRIRKAELLDFEHVGPSRYYNVLTNELQMIVESSRQFVSATSSAWMALAGVLYIALLSFGAAVATGITLLIGFSQFYRSNRATDKMLAETRAMEGTFLDGLRELRDGFKELKINQKKNDGLFEDYIVRNAMLAESMKVETSKTMTRNMVFAQCYMFALLGSVVFLMPAIFGLDASKQTQIIAVLIFILGPITEIVTVLPGTIKAGAAVINVQQLEADLQRLKPVSLELPDPVERFGPFQELEIDGVTFSYERQHGARPFGLKPVNLTVRRGEVIFIVGGNGSGKSTLLHLLCGLYRAQSGEIRVNGKRVEDEDITAFRALFGIILQDYHLFGRLYGNPNPDLVAAEKLLRELKIDGKTSIRADGSIETLDLSGGQRKRLAMVVTRLDDPQIFIFDEWAADQDPAYKRYFYQDLLPRLSKAEKTIIVVSHDERYFPADYRNVYQMEEGQLVPYTSYPGESGGRFRPLLPPSGK